jgi:predicted amidohydrolase
MDPVGSTLPLASRFSVAGLQLALDAADNLAAIAGEIDATMARYPGLQMLVLPELASFGPALAHAQPLPGPAEQFYQALARRHGVWLITGSLYERDGERIHNTASAIDPDGVVVARHRKIYPFLPYETGVTPGDRVTVFDVPGVARFGLSICYDGWFPEVARDMACAGAEVMLLPSMTGTVDREQELVLARAQAISNQCCVVNVNIAGALGLGRSIMVGPVGEVLHQAGGLREIIPLRLDLDALRDSRQRGLLGLGQVLKSFRDTPVNFDCYDRSRPRSSQLDALGPMTRWPAAGPRG